VDLYPVEPIRIRFVAGYGLAAAVPTSLKQACLLLIAHWYEAREAAGSTVSEVAGIPFGVEALVRSYRREMMR
jgi:uncharacterized phiE125 gp8 family phage protein